MHPTGRASDFGSGTPLPIRHGMSSHSAAAQTNFYAHHAPTNILRTRSCPLVVLVTIHDTRWSHVLNVPVVVLNVMTMHAFEAL
jgi:hypothetical protein